MVADSFIFPVFISFFVLPYFHPSVLSFSISTSGLFLPFALPFFHGSRTSRCLFYLALAPFDPFHHLGVFHSLWLIWCIVLEFSKWSKFCWQVVQLIYLNSFITSTVKFIIWCSASSRVQMYDVAPLPPTVEPVLPVFRLFSSNLASSVLVFLLFSFPPFFLR